MRNPRMVAIVFESMVRAIGAAKFVRIVSMPVAALITVSVIAIAEAPLLIQVRDQALQTLDDISQASGVNHLLGREHLRSQLELKNDPELMLEFGPAPKLNQEQMNLAKYIAKTYRISFERTQHYVNFAYQVAREKGMDPVLLLSVMAGAQGLMQVLTRVHVEKFAPFGGPVAAFEPLPNIHVGARILREYIARDGSVEQGLKAYVGAALMSQDSGYGSKVLFERERLQAVAAGRPLPVMVVPSAPAAKPEPTQASDIEPVPALMGPEPKPAEGRDSASL
jgi:hypothetical protein